MMNSFGYYGTAGRILPLHFPNVIFDVVNVAPGTPDQVMEQIDRSKPDIVMFDKPEIYVKMLEQGSLLDLSTRIKQDSFELEQMHTPIVHYLKEISGGGVFGLAPVFNSTAIYYNIDLFNKFGIPYPTDQMSWEELYRLAARFPTREGDTKIFGFRYYGTISGQLFLFAQAEHLSYYDTSMKNLQMNTEPMRRLFQSIMDWNKKGIVDTNVTDQFLTGNVAMTLEDTNYITTLKEKGSGINWSIVTRPSFSQDRGISHSIRLDNIYSIYAQSPSPDLAWQILRFVNGDAVAQLQFQSLSSRVSKYSKEKSGVSLEPFYRLNMDTFGTYENIRRNELPANYAADLSKLINLKADAVLKGKLLPDEALEQIQTEGRQLLRSANAP
ncbi:extracellular solute-binding protein [Paenibacillus ginsengarvi]|nr:extracellular solute-binding protein [Paenibacillus ginsengarvi]